MRLIAHNVKCKKSFIMKRPKDILSQPYHIQEYINYLERKNFSLHSVSHSDNRYCEDCGDYVKDGCDNKDCKDFKSCG